MLWNPQQARSQSPRRLRLPPFRGRRLKRGACLTGLAYTYTPIYGIPEAIPLPTP